MKHNPAQLSFWEQPKSELLPFVPTKAAEPTKRGEYTCLSLYQPWASLIAYKAKRIETRSWSTQYRGPLVICSGKNDDYLAELLGVYQRHCNPAKYPSFQLPAFHMAAIKVFTAGMPDRYSFHLPLGCAVCICDLVNVVPTESLTNLDGQDRLFGNYGSGRFAWILSNIRAFDKPIPTRGAQGLFKAFIEGID